MDADSRPWIVEKYTPDPMRKVPTPTASNTTRIGKKNGNPIVRTPNTRGSNATDAAASGTVGTNRIFADGSFNGSACVNDDTVLFVERDIVSMMWNHDWASDSTAPISVRYGPERHNLIRSVG